MELDRQIRAFNPWPIAQAMLEGKTLRIHAAYAIEDIAQAALEGRESRSVQAGFAGGPIAPGTITGLRSDGLEVLCGRGRLVLTEVQRPGRRKVAARELAGRGSLTGHRFD